jgi:hypothetical protein
MNTKFFMTIGLLFTLTNAFAMEPLKAQAQRFNCKVVVTKSESFFETMKFDLDKAGNVSGTYQGNYSSHKETDLTGRSGFMSINHTPVAKVNLVGEVEIVMDFQGTMGSDEDIFTLRIQPRTGKAKLDHKFTTDCGDGQWQKSPSMDYVCTPVL